MIKLMVKQKKWIFLILISVYCSVSTGSFAQTKIKYDGYISTGFGYIHNDTQVRILNKGKVEYKIYTENDIKGELDIRTSSNSNDVKIKGLYIRLSDSKPTRIKFGFIKKRFGLEETVNHEELHTINESIINRYMAYFGYVVRGEGVEISHDSGENENAISYRIGTFYNENQKIYFLGRITKQNYSIFDRVSIGGIYRISTKGFKRNHFALSLDAGNEFRYLYWENEFFYGEDPIETEYRSISDSGNNVRFFGYRTLIKTEHLFNSTYIKSVEPVMLFCFLAPDVDQFDVHRLQTLIGVNIYSAPKVRFMINGDLVLSNNSVTKDKYYMTDSCVSCKVQLRW